MIQLDGRQPGDEIEVEEEMDEEGASAESFRVGAASRPGSLAMCVCGFWLSLTCRLFALGLGLKLCYRLCL